SVCASHPLISTYCRLTDSFFLFVLFTDAATTEISTLSLHDALPISHLDPSIRLYVAGVAGALIVAALALWSPVIKGHGIPEAMRSEEHTSELQSRENLVCRLLLEKKNIQLQPELKYHMHT